MHSLRLGGALRSHQHSRSDLDDNERRSDPDRARGAAAPTAQTLWDPSSWGASSPGAQSPMKGSESPLTVVAAEDMPGSPGRLSPRRAVSPKGKQEKGVQDPEAPMLLGSLGMNFGWILDEFHGCIGLDGMMQFDAVWCFGSSCHVHVPLGANVCWPQATSSLGAALYRLEGLGGLGESQHISDWSLSARPGLSTRRASRECGFNCLWRISRQVGPRGRNRQKLCSEGRGRTMAHWGCNSLKDVSTAVMRFFSILLSFGDVANRRIWHVSVKKSLSNTLSQPAGDSIARYLILFW